MTIQDFARELGVSTATISRAIHDRGRVSPATREMVLQRMKELGYTPNLHAQRLVTGRSHMIALEFQDQIRVLSDMYSVTLSGHIQQALRQKGFGLLLNLMDETQQDRLLRQWVKSRAVDGAIVVADPGTDRTLLCELAPVAPFVVIGHQPMEGIPQVVSVVVALQSGARHVAQHLVNRRHRRIGFIGSRLTDPVIVAFREELQSIGIALPEKFVRIAGPGREDGARAMAELLESTDRPTAVFCRTDNLAVGALRAAKERGLRIPQDISLVGHDDVEYAQWTDPQLTTVRVDCAELARATSESLCALIEGSTEPRARWVPSTLVLRDSVATPSL